MSPPSRTLPLALNNQTIKRTCDYFVFDCLAPSWFNVSIMVRYKTVKSKNLAVNITIFEREEKLIKAGNKSYGKKQSLKNLQISWCSFGYKIELKTDLLEQIILAISFLQCHYKLSNFNETCQIVPFLQYQKIRFREGNLYFHFLIN